MRLRLKLRQVGAKDLPPSLSQGLRRKTLQREPIFCRIEGRHTLLWGFHMTTIVGNDEELDAAIARLHEPEAFAQFCALNQDFLNSDAAQFEQRVPPERVQVINKLYGVIKLYAPDYFDLLLPFCTAIGELSDELFEPILHSGLRHAMRVELKCDQPELSINDLCLQIVLALFTQVQHYIAQFNDDYDALRKHQPSAEESRWLARYYLAYMILSHHTDPAMWTYRQVCNGMLMMCDKIVRAAPEN